MEKGAFSDPYTKYIGYMQSTTSYLPQTPPALADWPIGQAAAQASPSLNWFVGQQRRFPLSNKYV